jgi:hypothetical protein
MTPAAELAGESLDYDIAFLWFDHLAEGRFSFAAAEEPGTYQAVLEARTLGVAGWLTGDRMQRYESVMREGPEGVLRSLSYQASVVTGKGKQRKEKIKRYLFDYRTAEVKFSRLKDGKVTRAQTLPLNKAIPPKDILTAFVNFRAGVLGPLAPNRRYVIPTFSHKGTSDIVIETLTEQERIGLPFPANGILARAKVDQEVFDTGGGSIYVWFDELGRPARGTVENVIGLGNVSGSLR